MLNLLVDTGEGWDRFGIEEMGKFPMPDGNTVWMFGCYGNTVMTRVGKEIDLMRVYAGAPDGLALEFGVASGNSIRRLAENPRTIYGFDWWRGLPHAWNDADGKGACLAAKPSDLPDNVILVEGLFSDTLEDFLKVHHEPVGFVHVDCDLYAPTCYLLSVLVDRFIAGSVIAFDEMDQGHYGEREAWVRYLQMSRQDWELVGKQHAFGEVWRKS